MARLRSYLLAPALLSQLAWAVTIPHNQLHAAGASLVAREEEEDKEVRPYFCPEQVGEDLWECDHEWCGGERPEHKGECKDPMSQTVDEKTLEIQDIWCNCTTKEDDDKDGDIPAIVPVPFIIPPGFPPPPPEVENPAEPNSCSGDLFDTKCKDCDGIKGWCTKGTKTGCPCQDECPAEKDDDFPKCGDDSCKGSDNKECTLGPYKDCDCYENCPNPDKEILPCDDEDCNSGKDKNKCKKGKYRGCGCHFIKAVSEVSKPPKSFPDMQKAWKGLGNDITDALVAVHKPDVKCDKDRTKAEEVETDFVKKLADEFCSGDKKKAELSSKDIDDDVYEEYIFSFEYDPGKDCMKSCEDVFGAMVETCQGQNSHSVQPEANATIKECGASYSYQFERPDPKPTCDQDKSSGFPANLFTESIYTKFCDSFERGKDQEWIVDSSGNNVLDKGDLEKRTPPPNSKSYADVFTTLQYSKANTKGCYKECADAFKELASSPCGTTGNQQNAMTKEGSLDSRCGVFSWEIKDVKEDLVAPHCYPKDAWGKFNPLPDRGDKEWKNFYLWGACGGTQPHSKIEPDNKMPAYHAERNGVAHSFGSNWIDGCVLKGDVKQEQDLGDPFGPDSDHHCQDIFTNLYFDCKDGNVNKVIGDGHNGGAGGWIQVGCANYSFKPVDVPF